MYELKNQNIYSNAFMIVSFLFIGLLFIIFMLLIDIVFGGNSVLKESVEMLVSTKMPFEKIISSRNLGFMSNIGLVGLAILSFYALGFLMYCLSMLLITIPSIYILRLFKYKDYARYATDKILKDDEKSKSFKFDERIDFLYLFLRTKNIMISQELKFLFNQIMFARSNLGGLIMAFLLKFIYETSLHLSIGFFISLIVCIAIYIYTIIFFDRMLYSSYLTNVI